MQVLGKRVGDHYYKTILHIEGEQSDPQWEAYEWLTDIIAKDEVYVELTEATANVPYVNQSINDQLGDGYVVACFLEFANPSMPTWT